MPAIPPLMAALHAWMRVFMQGSMGGFMRYARGAGLSMQHFGVLHYLHHRGAGRAVSDIGEDLGVTSAAASQMIERLVQQGLVQRSETPDDRRVRLVHLTAAGQQVVTESIQAQQGWLEPLLAALTDEQRIAVSQALCLLTEQAARLEASRFPRETT